LLTGDRADQVHAGERLAFGVEGLDDMLRGGVMDGTTTLVLGSPGAGKTTTCLHFLIEGARRGERGLIATFHESPERLIAKASAVGLDLGACVEQGLIRILWHAPLELLLDAWNRDVLNAVESHQPRRFVIDGLTELQRLTAYPERLPAYLAALTTLLRSRSATTLLSAEATTVVGAPLDLPIPTLAATVENALLLRYVEVRSQLHRLISIIKTRESDYDTSIREFHISPRGLRVADSFESAEAVLTGFRP
jgi:circadian clock protein KaiC